MLNIVLENQDGTIGACPQKQVNGFCEKSVVHTNKKR